MRIGWVPRSREEMKGGEKVGRTVGKVGVRVGEDAREKTGANTSVRASTPTPATISLPTQTPGPINPSSGLTALTPTYTSPPVTRQTAEPGSESSYLHAHPCPRPCPSNSTSTSPSVDESQKTMEEIVMKQAQALRTRRLGARMAFAAPLSIDPRPSPTSISPSNQANPKTNTMTTTMTNATKSVEPNNTSLYPLHTGHPKHASDSKPPQTHALNKIDTTSTATLRPATATGAESVGNGGGRMLRRVDHLRVARTPGCVFSSEDLDGNGKRPISEPFFDGGCEGNKSGMGAEAKVMGRARAATTSRTMQASSHAYTRTNMNMYEPRTPTTPVTPVRVGHPSRPIYSVIRKNGVCLSNSPVLAPNAVPPETLGRSVTSSPVGSVRSSGLGSVYGYGYGYGPGQVQRPTSPVSPYSYTFGPSGCDKMLIELEAYAGTSSSSSSMSSFSNDDDDDGSIRGRGMGLLRPLRKLKSKCSTRFRSVKSLNKSTRAMSPASGTSSTSPSSMRTFHMPVPMSIPIALSGKLGGAEFGCSMSGEAELRLALARSRSPVPVVGEPYGGGGGDGVGSPGKVVKGVKRLREMVSRTF
ncbi:hypothetical protein AMATHDRAFT_6946 [Amanita thiersii Skay4041]|uniref:Uncharacterized protein n=1 Tax=Amanita thiersii Skay4041 TaxID=703135 RepID=A0A2A9NHR8_9AGAR|nr:hypothetical protein AMATHDRAFT_6946 [Amanita thiersii Skay4041]